MWAALEAGTAHAQWYAEQRQKDEPAYRLEGTVASDLTRSRAKSYLKEQGRLEVEDFEPLEVGNIGLRIRIQGYDIRI